MDDQAAMVSDASYRRVYAYLRADPKRPGKELSLRSFVGIIALRRGRPGLSIAYWSKFQRGLIGLTETARDELRAAMGWPAARALGADVTRLQRPERRRARKTVHLCPAAWLEANSARQRMGLSWDEFMMWSAQQA